MKPKRHSSITGRWARASGLLLAGLLSSAIAQTLCQDPRDESRAKELYEQARQQPENAKAVEWLQESSKLCPGVFQPIYSLAKTLLQLQRYSEAESAASAAAAAAASEAWESQLMAWGLVAEAQRGQNQWQEAKFTYDVIARALLQPPNGPTRIAPDWFNKDYAAFEEALAARGGLKAGEIAGILKKKMPGVKPRISLRVEFDYDKATLTPQGQAQLREVARAMSEEATRAYSFQVIGHTDKRGTPEYNQSLSERRAQATVAELNRLQPELGPRLHPEGKGATNPRIPDATDEAQHATNRRVEFEAKSIP